MEDIDLFSGTSGAEITLSVKDKSFRGFFGSNYDDKDTFIDNIKYEDNDVFWINFGEHYAEMTYEDGKILYEYLGKVIACVEKK